MYKTKITATVKQVHSTGEKLTFLPLSEKFIIKTAKTMNKTEQIKGAITGPSQLQGIRNSKSHVKNDEGQFRHTLRKT
mgnify:CR=1 FL=1